MHAPSLASCLESLQKSNLLTPDQRKELTAAPPTDKADPQSLAQELVRRGWLTRFQADRFASDCRRCLLRTDRPK